MFIRYRDERIFFIEIEVKPVENYEDCSDNYFFFYSCLYVIYSLSLNFCRNNFTWLQYGILTANKIYSQIFFGWFLIQ